MCSDRLDTDFPDIDLSQLDTSDFDSVNCLSELQWCNDQPADASPASIHYSTADELFEVRLVRSSVVPYNSYLCHGHALLIHSGEACHQRAVYTDALKISSSNFYCECSLSSFFKYFNKWIDINNKLACRLLVH